MAQVRSTTTERVSALLARAVALALVVAACSSAPLVRLRDLDDRPREHVMKEVRVRGWVTTGLGECNYGAFGDCPNPLALVCYVPSNEIHAVQQAAAHVVLLRRPDDFRKACDLKGEDCGLRLGDYAEVRGEFRRGQSPFLNVHSVERLDPGAADPSCLPRVP